ncbi:hypothetical protein UFOVP764_13 [uncultured Caudovirales phage]|uniref:Uncharacterized protein n=1 Tax=uncultured Caudovirales phage TaxID=2100421 RepID=A0A6J5NLM2_9CAUD|nr:hypothetical protein UFOVP764_13 [uncultured Caudovirales phage]
MSNRRIIYPTNGGCVAVIIPAPEWLAQECNTLETLATNSVPPGKPWKIVDASDIPTDRAFRNAWKLEDDQITEDWAKSVEITKNRLREERKPLFEAADVKAMRDIEATGSISPETAALKQSLRDVTALADAAQSRDDLIALKVT